VSKLGFLDPRFLLLIEIATNGAELQAQEKCGLVVVVEKATLAI